MNTTLRQVKNFKKVMSNAISVFFDENRDDVVVDNFYTSSFTITFNDKTTGKQPRIDLFICPETWELMEDFIKEIPEALEDYE